MHKVLSVRVIAALVATALGTTCAGAHEIKRSGFVIVHPWVRAAPAAAAFTAGYGKIKNTRKIADRLIGASLTGTTSAELLANEVSDGEPVTRRLPGGVPIAPGGTMELKPGVLRIMFYGLTKPLEPDVYVDGALIFEKAGRVPITFFVEPMASPTPSPDGQANQQHHEHH